MAKQKEADLLKLVKGRLDVAKRAREKQDIAVRKWRKLWLGEDPNVATVDRQRVIVSNNVIFSNIETLMPMIFDKPPEIEVRGREPGDFTKADLAGAVLDYYLYKNNMDKLFREAVRRTLIDGLTWFKETYKFEEKRIAVTKEEDVKTLFGKKKKKVTEVTQDFISHDDPHTELVSHFNMFVDPEGAEVEDMKYVIERVTMPLEQARLEYGDMTLQSNELVMSENKDDMLASDLKKETDDMKRITLFLYWGTVDPENKEERFIVFTNKKILKNIPNPYEHGKKPYIACKFYQVLDKFYPISEVHNLANHQLKLNEMYGQVVEHIKRMVNPITLVDKTIVDQDTLEQLKDPRSGRIVGVNSLSSVQMVTPPSINTDMWRYLDQLQIDMQTLSGISDIQKGGASKQSTTARGVIIQEESSSRKVRHKTRIFADCIEELMKLKLSNIAQFVKEERIIRILGDRLTLDQNVEVDESGNRFKRFTGEDLKGDLDVIIEAGSLSTTNRETKQAMMINLRNTFAGDPNIDLFEIDKRLLDAFEIKNRDAVLNNPEEQQEQAQGEQPQGEVNPVSIPPLPAFPGAVPQQDPLDRVPLNAPTELEQANQ